MITKELVIKVREWIDDDGAANFIKELLVEGNWVNLHFSTGMNVRNFMRQSHLCTNWSTDDYDNSWQRVIEKAIAEDYTDEELINDRDS